MAPRAPEEEGETPAGKGEDDGNTDHVVLAVQPAVTGERRGGACAKKESEEAATVAPAAAAGAGSLSYSAHSAHSMLPRSVAPGCAVEEQRDRTDSARRAGQLWSGPALFQPAHHTAPKSEKD